MFRASLSLLLLVLSILSVEGRGIVVVDSLTHIPLPNATVFDHAGSVVGITDASGRLPIIVSTQYPLSISYLGYRSKRVAEAHHDTIFLVENVSELPEVVFESKANNILHILAYVRDYSQMSTNTDTVRLFREKMVDFMLPPPHLTKFKGWIKPRVLTSKSYYRFTDSNGLDSVGDSSPHHFSWSDWMGIPPGVYLPASLRNTDSATDTVYDKYGPVEIWSREGDMVDVRVNVIGNKSSRRWVPTFDSFFSSNIDYERFKLHLRYGDVTADSLSPLDLAGYSFDIDSHGRHRTMFRFNKINESFFVSTHAEVYILDKEYITLKEAKKWSDRRFDIEETGILEPLDAPPLDSATTELIARVNSLDIDAIRLSEIHPDYRFMSRHSGRENFKIGRRALGLLKGITGISTYKHHRNMKRRWRKFSDEQKQRNVN